MCRCHLRAQRTSSCVNNSAKPVKLRIDFGTSQRGAHIHGAQVEEMVKMNKFESSIISARIYKHNVDRS